MTIRSGGDGRAEAMRPEAGVTPHLRRRPIQAAEFFFAVAMRLVPRRYRFGAALFVSRAATPLLRLTDAYRKQELIGFDGPREIALHFVLNALTRNGARFDPIVEVRGLAELERACAAGTGVLVLGPHAALTLLMIRLFYDRGLDPVVITPDPGMRVAGTTLKVRTVQPSPTFLVKTRGGLRRGELVCAMPDRAEHHGARTVEFVTADGRVIVAPALMRVAARCGARVIFTEVHTEGGSVVGSIHAPDRFGIYAAAWNTVFYNGLKLAFLLPVLGRWRRPAWPSPTAREAWRLFMPILPGQAYLRAEPLLDRFLASTKEAGSLSLLYVAQQMYANAILVTNKAVIAPLSPKLALAAGEGGWWRFRRAYRARLLLLALLSTLGGLLLMAFGPHALRLAIGHVGVTAENVHTLRLVIIALVGAFFGGVSGQVVSGAFYAMGDTKTPTKVSALIYTLYLPLKIAVFLGYGLIGLAITMSAYFVVSFLVQFVMLEGEMSGRLKRTSHE